MRKFSYISTTALLFMVAIPVFAAFSTGPVFEKYGRKTLIEGVSLDNSAQFNVAFDVASKSAEDKINRNFDSVARFMNMHVASGVAQKNIKLAIVVHGSATLDLLTNKTYQTKHNAPNPNIAIVNALLDEGVKIIVCGQSMSAHDLSPDQFVDGVEVSLSAMTAHAQLQQQGYTLNPF
ncbi:DsrE family protein [Salinimonas chungwhensis]|uniref:DsrE family protein n=1 Tax=Salinimonas chungwhensis TaxID=265425 RepID=UPI0003708260|nr:DsrE family protein [Salinimonas chungwhensis]